MMMYSGRLDVAEEIEAAHALCKDAEAAYIAALSELVESGRSLAVETATTSTCASQRGSYTRRHSAWESSSTRSARSSASTSEPTQSRRLADPSVSLRSKADRGSGR